MGQHTKYRNFGTISALSLYIASLSLFTINLPYLDLLRQQEHGPHNLHYALLGRDIKSLPRFRVGAPFSAVTQASIANFVPPH
jgi:hypothetical protein